jgi:hypothetical protein
MCACKETDVRESGNDCTLTSREGHGSCGETCHPMYNKKPVSSMIIRTVLQTTNRYFHSREIYNWSAAVKFLYNSTCVHSVL